VRTLILLIGLCLQQHAFAFTEPSGGLEFDLGTGLVQHDMSYGYGWSVSAMTWRGRYDNAYSLGNFIAGGATVEFDWLSPEPGWTATAELRKGITLLAVNTYAFVAGGANIGEDGLSTAIRTGASVRFRPHLNWSAGLRFELGVDIAKDAIPFRAAVLLNGNFWHPFKAPPKEP
jgi:hypothetical protein